MDSIVAAGDESTEPSQPVAEALALPPILSRVTSALPALCAAEQALTRAILGSRHLVLEAQLALLAAAGDHWPPAVRNMSLPELLAGSLSRNDALDRFGRKLAQFGPWFAKGDYDQLVEAGLSGAAIVQAVASIALGHFRCTLAAGLLTSDWSGRNPAPAPNLEWSQTSAPFPAPNPISGSALDAEFAQIRAVFGFVPGLLQLQNSVPDIVRAEVNLIDALFGSEDHLSQTQKHCIALRLAAANCSNYLVALHGEILNLIGAVSEETLELLNASEMQSLPEPDKILCTETQKLRIVPCASAEPLSQARLSLAGLNESQVAEAVATAAVSNFLATLQFGLGAIPDFSPLRTFQSKDLYLFEGERRPSSNRTSVEDPDLEFVGRVKAGETEAFEHLVRNHTGRVFRTLSGLLGNHEEARDATQETFLKAFQNIDGFEGRAKFSTWLTSIAVNTGTEILRQRRPIESLDLSDDNEGFRPRQVRSWVDSPEEVLAKTQVNELVRHAVLRLPETYRAALLLRDINQLSTEETAEALGLSLPATKARILRGRLMLRESLAPHFTKPEGDRHV